MVCSTVGREELMRGQRRAPRRLIAPDSRYDSALVSRLVNRLMLAGKKQTAMTIVYRALRGLEEAVSQPGDQALDTAIKNVAPLVEVRSKRIGGATYQVPMEVRPERKEALAMRWIIAAARSTKGLPMAEALKNELRDGYNATGAAMKKREDLHKMAEANKAFAHFVRF